MASNADGTGSAHPAARLQSTQDQLDAEREAHYQTRGLLIDALERELKLHVELAETSDQLAAAKAQQKLSDRINWLAVVLLSLIGVTLAVLVIAGAL